jgi:hypothetical protein
MTDSAVGIFLPTRRNKMTWINFFAGFGVITFSMVICAVILCLLMPDEIQELEYPEDAE